MSRQWHRVMALCLLFGAAACARHDPPSEGFAGTWVMSLGQRTFMVLTLTNRGDSFTGSLSRPERFETGDGVRFSHISATDARETVVSVSMRNDHLHFTTENPKDKEDRTEYDMTLAGKDEASIKLLDAPFEALAFRRIRSANAPTVAKDWEPQRSYPEESAVSNAEMQRVYDEDQKPRQNPGTLSARDWEIINQGDAARREQTRRLIADGQLHTGEDFRKAAFIFQHGATPDDYLLAHTLALIATAKGDASASWIGSATLDRYLQSTGKPQIYGTQFKTDPANPDGPAIQEPFNRDLIGDGLRRQLGVPVRSAQQEQLKYAADLFKPAASKSK